MSIGPFDPPGSSSTVINPLEPYQSASFRHLQDRMHTLSTSPAHSPAMAHRQVRLTDVPLDSTSSVASGSRPQRYLSTTPSPPVSESSSCHPISPRSQPLLSPASDSSASCCTDVDVLHRHSVASLTCSSGRLNSANRARPSLASKRVLSESDITLPHDVKRRRLPAYPSVRKRSRRIVSASSSLARPSSIQADSSFASWHMAREQQRRRQLARSSKVDCTSTEFPTLPRSATSTKSDTLPELRLLSATRTAPIGWSQFSGASSFVPHMVEVYDERDAKRAPERQRFWPIIDHQLDYTGARLLSLSNTPHGPLSLPHAYTDDEAKLFVDGPVSPKSGLPLHHSSVLSSLQQPVLPDYTQPLGSSEDDLSPATPDTPSRSSVRVPNQPSRQARDAVSNESHRQARFHLSPPATLLAVIDFTRAQAAGRQEAERNADGHRVLSLCSPPVKSKRDLAPHAPGPIRPQAALCTRDYFGHWETFLSTCGKESTF